MVFQLSLEIRVVISGRSSYAVGTYDPACMAQLKGAKMRSQIDDLGEAY